MKYRDLPWSFAISALPTKIVDRLKCWLRRATGNLVGIIIVTTLVVCTGVFMMLMIAIFIEKLIRMS